jgi:uncharacterized metal-binding protein
MQVNVESATLDAANDAVTILVLDGAEVVRFELVLGTLAGGAAVTFEAQGPSEVWHTAGAMPIDGGTVETTSTTAGVWTLDVRGLKAARMRLSTEGTGTGTGYAATGK